MFKDNLLIYHRSTKTMSFLDPRVTRYSLRSAHQLFDPARSSPAVCFRNQFSIKGLASAVRVVVKIVFVTGKSYIEVRGDEE